MKQITLGFEVGTGTLVEIPLKHMAVTGQTQESGKTTTLEALVSRAGARALAFVTKRGETSFADCRRVQPYFRDRADWQFVTSIIDATLQEKNKFLRPWIIRICRQTKTLADVQQEVRTAKLTAKGISHGVYEQLDAYLDLIVPEIRRARLAESLDLRDGINVMDVGEFDTPMQMLFVQSAIDWINDNERDVILIIPEAWEFIPEGKGSPVKASAIALVRKGGALNNFIWVDSQDMAGVDKTILRGCTVWLIGVQREANEIKRNLNNIPAGIEKPKPKDIALLDRGQFFACWKGKTIKTYVQPAWMGTEEARGIAFGTCTIDDVRKPQPKPTKSEDRSVNEQEARELRRENADLKAQLHNMEVTIERIQTRSAAPNPGVAANGDFEDTYRSIKSRLMEEAPGLIRLLTSKPELEITVERPTIEADSKSLFGRVARLVASGWFKEHRTNGATCKELARTGKGVNSGNLSRELDKLIDMGFLTDEVEGYKEVPGAKVRVKES